MTIASISRGPGARSLATSATIVCENPIAFANAERLFLNRVLTGHATRLWIVIHSGFALNRCGVICS